MRKKVINKNATSPDLLLLQEISSVIVHERDINTLLKRVLSILYKKIGVKSSFFTLREGDTLKIEASYKLTDDEEQLSVYHMGEGIIRLTAESATPQYIEDIARDKQFLNSPSYQGKIAFLSVPVIHARKAIGTLCVFKSANNDELQSDLSLLEIVANITAEAVAASLKEHSEKKKLLEENRQLRTMLNGGVSGLVGTSRNMQEIYSLIKQVANSDATVLIRGSTGTGKEMVARAVVGLSNRKGKPFVTLNCAALPENLVESELFGHEKGAFTGADKRRIGRAEAADTGTLFLDEVGDLSLASQVKLLRFIQERIFSRLGSSEDISSDVRFIAATSRNLEELMQQGLFREDLYYRLNIFPIIMPDLKERKSDITLLADHFITKHNLRYGKSITRLSTPAINMLMSYYWPGNVRELENCIERAVITSTDDCIHGYNLPPSLQTDISSGTRLLPDGKVSFNMLMDSFERELITEALKRNNKNMSAAARELLISPRVMHYKIKNLGITL